MKDATIFVLGDASAEDLSFLALRDGEARRVGGVPLVDLSRGNRSPDPQV